MPGHFLVRDRVLHDVFVDPFSAGRILSRAECRQLFHQIAGPGSRFDDRYLDPVSEAAILQRMVANLVNAYQRADDRHGARCPGVTPTELLHLAQLLVQTGAYGDAAIALDAAADQLDESRASDLRREAARQRARLN